MADEDDVEPFLARRLTVPGRLLFVVTLLGAGAVLVLYILESLPGFPAGRYPVYMWALPVAMAGVLFFFGAAFALEKLGVRIYRRRPD